MSNLLVRFAALISLPSLYTDLPVMAFRGNDPSLPIILYLSGDGGWNRFSTGMLHDLNKAGYPVLGLNTKTTYFRNNTPEQIAGDMTDLLDRYLKNWERHELVFVGYSFGADLTPFILNRLDKEISRRIRHTVLISPSEKTDLRIHLIDVPGWRGQMKNVPDEIKKLTMPVTVIRGSREHAFPAQKMKAGNIRVLILEGGHHFGGQVDKLASGIIASIR